MNEDQMLDAVYEERFEIADEREELEATGWPGDGSGEDDLADYNANEADDYRDEGADNDPADEPADEEPPAWD